VIHDPLANELCFELRYHQVYTQNTDGLTAGTLHWSRYMGDRQRGWLGNRPICDILVKLPCFTEAYEFGGDRRSPLRRMEAFLQVMTARYRIGDGHGATYVGPADNYCQDANQALFAAIQQMSQEINAKEVEVRQWAANHPEQAARFQQLLTLGNALKQVLQPLGKPRPDWEKNEFNLSSTLEYNYTMLHI
jgi:predicted Abi (CAAX) family protease